MKCRPGGKEKEQRKERESRASMKNSGGQDRRNTHSWKAGCWPFGEIPWESDSPSLVLGLPQKAYNFSLYSISPRRKEERKQRIIYCPKRTRQAPLSNPEGLPGVEEPHRSHKQTGRVAVKQEAAGQERRCDPYWCGSVCCKAKGRRFDSRSGHIMCPGCGFHPWLGHKATD